MQLADSERAKEALEEAALALAEAHDEEIDTLQGAQGELARQIEWQECVTDDHAAASEEFLRIKDRNEALNDQLAVQRDVRESLEAKLNAQAEATEKLKQLTQLQQNAIQQLSTLPGVREPVETHKSAPAFRVLSRNRSFNVKEPTLLSVPSHHVAHRTRVATSPQGAKAVLLDPNLMLDQLSAARDHITQLEEELRVTSFHQTRSDERNEQSKKARDEHIARLVAKLTAAASELSELSAETYTLRSTVEHLEQAEATTGRVLAAAVTERAGLVERISVMINESRIHSNNLNRVHKDAIDGVQATLQRVEQEASHLRIELDEQGLKLCEALDSGAELAVREIGLTQELVKSRAKLAEADASGIQGQEVVREWMEVMNAQIDEANQRLAHTTELYQEKVCCLEAELQHRKSSLKDSLADKLHGALDKYVKTRAKRQGAAHDEHNDASDTRHDMDQCCLMDSIPKQHSRERSFNPKPHLVRPKPGEKGLVCVTVPLDGAPGDSLEVQHAGQSYSVRVPVGVYAGEPFVFRPESVGCW